MFGTGVAPDAAEVGGPDGVGDGTTVVGGVGGTVVVGGAIVVVVTGGAVVVVVAGGAVVVVVGGGLVVVVVVGYVGFVVVVGYVGGGLLPAPDVVDSPMVRPATASAAAPVPRSARLMCPPMSSCTGFHRSVAHPEPLASGRTGRDRSGC